MARTMIQTTADVAREAAIACSLLKAEFLADGTAEPFASELATVRSELDRIESKTNDPAIALMLMRKHLADRLMPNLDLLRRSNGLDTTYCEQVLAS